MVEIMEALHPWPIYVRAILAIALKKNPFVKLLNPARARSVKNVNMDPSRVVPFHELDE